MYLLDQGLRCAPYGLQLSRDRQSHDEPGLVDHHLDWIGGGIGFVDLLLLGCWGGQVDHYRSGPLLHKR